ILLFFLFFFFNDTATTEIYTLSLHDALPISAYEWMSHFSFWQARSCTQPARSEEHTSELHHQIISYAVFCLKKKKNKEKRLYASSIDDDDSLGSRADGEP